MADDVSLPPSRKTLFTDSALVLAIVSAALYFIGDLERTIRYAILQVPSNLTHELSVQQNIRQGAVIVLFMICPVSVLAILFTRKLFPGLMRRLADQLRDDFGSLHLTAITLISVAALTIVVGVIAFIMVHTKRRTEVIEIVFKKDARSLVLPHPLYYVAATEDQFVMVDRWAKPGAAVILVARDQVAKIVLKEQ